MAWEFHVRVRGGYKGAWELTGFDLLRGRGGFVIGTGYWTGSLRIHVRGAWSARLRLGNVIA